MRSDPRKVLTQSGVLHMTSPRRIADDTQPVLIYSDERAFCLICCDEFSIRDSDWVALQQCRHGFCFTCLREYITNSYIDKSSGVLNAGGLKVVCPHHECQVIMIDCELKTLLSSTNGYEILTHSENEGFILKASDYQFCPHPGCTGIVHRVLLPHLRANFDNQCIDFVGATCSSINKNIKRAAKELAIPAGCTYEGVLINSVFDFDTQPPVAHRFCFACKTVPH
ncbi:MAG: hypothetical protein ACREBR_03535, partial [bacterium]